MTFEFPLDFRGSDPVMGSGWLPDLDLCPERWVTCSFHNKWGALLVPGPVLEVGGVDSL